MKIIIDLGVMAGVANVAAHPRTVEADPQLTKSVNLGFKVFEINDKIKK